MQYLGSGVDTILLATDFTEQAHLAFDAAVRLARLLSARLVLLHVNEEETFFAGHDSADLSRLLSEIVPKRAEWMRGFEERAQELGLDAEAITRDGLASDTILATADELNAGVIVIGTTGTRGVRRFFTGSTAKNVLRSADRPVVAVSPQATVTPPEDGGTYSHILYPTDFSIASEAGLAGATTCLAGPDRMLTLLHVLRLPTMLPSLPGDPLVVLPSASSDDLQRRLDRDLQAAADRVGAESVNTTVVMHADVAEAICEVATREGADLIVLPRHSSHTLASFFFGHVAEELSKMAPVPVLLFHPSGPDEG